MTEVAVPPTITVVQQQEEPASGAGTQQNGSEPNGVAVNGNSTVTPTATTTVETIVVNGKSPKKQKEPEPPKDPKEDPFGWIQQQSKTAKHKVNYELLQWAQNQAVSDEAKRQPLPGKTDKVTSSQFLSSLRDGVILANLANTFAAGSVETVHEGEDVKANKENQVSNLQGFINFAKEKAGLAEEQVFTVADLQDKGKAGYEAVFNTLFQIAMKAQDKFNQAGIDVDRIAEEASNLVDPNILQKVIAFFPLHLFKKAGTPAAEKSQVAQQATEGEKQENGTDKVTVVEQQLSQVEVTAAVPVTESTPAVPTS
ncbi:calponin homology (CH) domain-containing protein [Ditylenchus destructor]|nr:calponin homology (CH) domain-containing protein [Ditylenchus destructor]